MSVIKNLASMQLVFAKCMFYLITKDVLISEILSKNYDSLCSLVQYPTFIDTVGLININNADITIMKIGCFLRHNYK